MRNFITIVAILVVGVSIAISWLFTVQWLYVNWHLSSAMALAIYFGGGGLLGLSLANSTWFISLLDGE